LSDFGRLGEGKGECGGDEKISAFTTNTSLPLHPVFAPLHPRTAPKRREPTLPTRRRGGRRQRIGEREDGGGGGREEKTEDEKTKGAASAASDSRHDSKRRERGKLNPAPSAFSKQPASRAASSIEEVALQEETCVILLRLGASKTTDFKIVDVPRDFFVL